MKTEQTVRDVGALATLPSYATNLVHDGTARENLGLWQSAFRRVIVVANRRSQGFWLFGGIALPSKLMVVVVLC